MTAKEEFISIFNEHIHRNGSKELLEWIQKTDFFTAPASTKYHCACECGLVMHSVSVFNTLMEKHFDEETDNIESYAICALLHDLCKAQFYKVSTRNVKNEETGQWEKVPYYAVEDSFPYGHGEKSVFLIERFMRLKIDEAMAIRWHMGGFEDSNGYTVSQAYEKYPLAVKLHLADLESTYLKEKGTSQVRNK
ncbi:MAG: hydrolase [Oscillospiraceae bacterium]|nr:hydrolase [Candidatus Ruminococcus equi]